MDEESDENMAKMITKLDLLTKYVIGDPQKAVNVINSKSVKDYDDDKEESPNKEIRFVTNQIVGSYPTYQRHGRNQDQEKRDHEWKDRGRKDHGQKYHDHDIDWYNKERNRECE